MPSRRHALIAPLALAAAPALAQPAEWVPSQPVRLVNPFAPGGSPDILARAMAPHAQAALGQPMVVENRPGAGGSVGARFVAQAAPDGHTVLLAAISAIIGPYMSQNAGYQVAELRPVSILTITPIVLVVRDNFPAQNVQEWDRVVRASPGRFNYATAGAGTPHQMAAELYAQLAGATITHVPYRGTAPALTDLRAGNVDFMFADLAAALGQVRQGGLRALAVTTDRRIPALADAPTMAESVLPGFEAYSFVSWMVPARTPDAAVARLNRVAVDALAQPDVQQRVAEFGFLPLGTDVAGAERIIGTETAKWSNLIRARNLRVED
ncbi:MAG: tripartite tricarboxylate transporter substrate binding protein [Acetobacteraceae bacterium]|nr:tripartite tricarboxylate transporter substrate binding protein [Acetobacteraceae bacterium]